MTPPLLGAEFMKVIRHRLCSSGAQILTQKPGVDDGSVLLIVYWVP